MLRLELEKELGRVRGELLKRETGPGSEEKGKREGKEGKGEVEWVEWFVGIWGVFEGRVVSANSPFSLSFLFGAGGGEGGRDCY